ncbi:MAG: M23 family metallopeptidase [Candidatus Aminicenantes bacterium]|nr:M23 family metallopeptidase [Candidatus Aminicenantes bacterium]
MGKKHLSLVVIPHTKTSHRTLSFSKRSVRTAAGLGIGLAVLLAAVTADYVRIRLTGKSYRALLSENTRQKDQLREYETKVNFLEGKINSFQDYAGKLNIFAGIKSPDLLSNPGVGGPSAGESSEPEPQAVGGQLSSLQNVRSLTQKAEDIEKSLGTLLSYFEQIQGQFATRPSIAPASGYRSSGYGWRMDPFNPTVRDYHPGLDIATVFGNPVVSTADGSILRVAYDAGLGNYIIVNHGNGITTRYGHLSKILVKSGQKVKRGDVIGRVGHTGRALGDHVHYEVRVNGTPVNPADYILSDF